MLTRFPVARRAYVEAMRKGNLELAAEYLLMAAMLIEIKSRMLLPPKKTADGQEPEDPRAELVRRLIEYEQMKLAAARLNALDALAAWECATCGARFPQRINPEMLKGVTCCSKCVLADVLSARLDATRAALTRLCDAVEAERKARYLYRRFGGDDTAWCDALAALDRADDKAREVLNG